MLNTANRVCDHEDIIPMLVYPESSVQSLLKQNETLITGLKYSMPAITPAINKEITHRYIENIKQEWRGVIVKVEQNEITAELDDVTHPDNPKERVTFSSEEVDPKDIPLARVGALFSWYIGYRDGISSQRERFSKLSFRRLPVISSEEVERKTRLSNELFDFFALDAN